MDKNNPNPGARETISRRVFLRAAAASSGMVLLAACGGNTKQANNGGTSNGSTKTTGNNTGGNGTGSGQKTPEQLNFQGPPTEVATQAQSTSGNGVSSTAVATQGTSGQTTAIATQGAEPTLATPKSFNESPKLAEQVKAGKLPKVTDRLPKNPLVLKPVEKVGTYGGTWETIWGDGASLIRQTGNENLLRWKPQTRNFTQADLMPNAVESYEIKNDGKQYVFKLREGMKWSDGKPFTADDLMFWYQDVMMNKDLTPAFPQWLMAGDKPPKVRKEDDYTVVFEFVQPSGLFLQNLATPNAWQLTNTPAHFLKQYHLKYNKDAKKLAKKLKYDDWVAMFGDKSGVYNGGVPDRPTLRAWRVTHPLGESTTHVVSERNPYYWKVDTEGNQLPYLDKVNFTIFNKLSVMQLKALNGELDIYSGGGDLEGADLQDKPIFYKNQQKGDYHFFNILPANMNVMILALNLTTRNKNLNKVFNDKNFRIGLSYAINRKEIINIVYVDQGEPWQAAPRPESQFHDDEMAKQYTEFDTKKANEYLDKVLPKKNDQGARLGPDGKPFSFRMEYSTGGSSSEFSDVLELCAKYFEDVGVTMHLKGETNDLFYTRKTGNEPDATVWHGDGGLEVMLETRWYFPSSSESNFAIPWEIWFNNPKDQHAIKPPPETRKQMQLYNQLRGTANPDEQAKLMTQILQIAKEQFYTIGISLPKQGYGVVKNDFHNVPDIVLGAWLYPTPAPTNPCQYFKQKQ